jgi:hypothetical protein
MKYHKHNIHKKHKFNTELCDSKLTFEECELEILRHAVDETEKKKGEKIANSEDIKNILSILEDFLRKKKLVCYGGTAINNILPTFAQFYNRDMEVPDYDFYSANALDDAKELADIYYKSGYVEVEAKAGVHYGTYKVFVNFIPIADITYLHPQIFNEMGKESIKVDGIYYCPANFLRMNMYLELSRPSGDVSRWEKVLKRLSLLNKYYPLNPGIDCSVVDFQRKMDSNTNDSEKLYYNIRDSFINQGVIFFGGYASSLYSKYMPEKQKHLVNKIPDFDVLSEDPEKTANVLKETLSSQFTDIHIITHDAIGEIIPYHIEVKVGKETLAFIYKPIACHSYNKIQIDHSLNSEVKIASIDTILSFYLAFIYANKPYYNKDRLLCMSKFLFDVEEKNRLEQKGLLKRFSIDCYGHQDTIEEIRAQKTNKFKELMNKKESKEYEAWFLKYNPGQDSASKVKPSIKKHKPSLKKSKTVKRKKRESEYLV